MKISKAKMAYFNQHTRDWERWVYDKKESHFFWFCAIHIEYVNRPLLDYFGSDHALHVCDYPGCVSRNTVEYFPNLIASLKEAEDDVANNRLYIIGGKKVKNYGESVQSKAVPKKRSKTTKLQVSSKKRSSKTSSDTSTDGLAEQEGEICLPLQGMQEDF